MKQMPDISTELRRWLERLHASESLPSLGIAILMGLLSGAGVWVFKQLFQLLQAFAFQDV